MNLEVNLGYQFKDKNLLKLALTHKSYFHENSKSLEFKIPDFMGTQAHNEKLEFLGDAVIDLAVSDILMKKYPADSEGNLSKKRASLVNESTLAELAEVLGIAHQMILGKGETSSGGEKKPRLLSSTLEALIGAIYSESGFSVACDCVQGLIMKRVESLASELDFVSDFKTRLQEIVQSEMKPVPTYKLVSESGPSHDRTFEVEVSINEYPSTKGVGKSKKSAEQEAARLALLIWQEKEKK